MDAVVTPSESDGNHTDDRPPTLSEKEVINMSNFADLDDDEEPFSGLVGDENDTDALEMIATSSSLPYKNHKDMSSKVKELDERVTTVESTLAGPTAIEPSGTAGRKSPTPVQTDAQMKFPAPEGEEVGLNKFANFM